MTITTPEGKLVDGEPIIKPWIDRMAEELSKKAHEKGDLSPGIIKAAMEAAVEMHCVQMKVALGRCWEIIESSRNTEEVVRSTEQFETYILGLSK